MFESVTEMCSVGRYVSGKCHSCKIKFDTYTEELKKVILLRIGATELELNRASNGNPTICLSHKAQVTVGYARNEKTCCDPFKTHNKKKCKSRLRELNLHFATQLRGLGKNVVPGQKLCRYCRKILKENFAKEMNISSANTNISVPSSTERVTKITVESKILNRKKKKRSVTDEVKYCLEGVEPCNEVEESDSGSNLTEQIEIASDPEMRENRKLALVEVNRRLAEDGLTPVKLHGNNESKRIRLGKRKHCESSQKFCKRLSIALDLEKERLQPNNLIEQDYNEYLLELKSKIKNSSAKEKISLLSLAPSSWSVNKISSEFDVTEHQIKRARELKKEQNTILPQVPEKAGKTLDKMTVDSISSYYEDDRFTRLCAGVKETVSCNIEGIRVKKQKRYMLLTTRELWLTHKNEFGSDDRFKVSQSKFASLRPPWVVPISSKTAHTVCVCMIHQNLKLMVEKLGPGISQSDIFEKLVCSRESKECMTTRCQNCPGNENLKNYLNDILINEECSADDKIKFYQWTQGKGACLEQKSENVATFIEELIKQANEATVHHYVSKSQAQYLKDLKSNLPPDTALILGDFAENYAFPIEESIQSYYFESNQATLHPFVIYTNEGGPELDIKCECVISDELKHDVVTVYTFMGMIINHLKARNPLIKRIIFFSDGAASQYKNFKNLMNLCKFKEDFDLDAEWNFFATSHGKSPCDGTGAALKQSAAQASKRARGNDGHILTPRDLFEYCEKNTKKIKVFWCSKSEVTEKREFLENRFKIGKTVPGIRCCHRFVPESDGIVKMYRMSSDETFVRAPVNNTADINIFGNIDEDTLIEGSFVACVVKKTWRIGKIEKKYEEIGEYNLNLLISARSSLSLSFPQIKESVFVPFSELIAVVEIQAKRNVPNQFTLPRKLLKHIKEGLNKINSLQSS